MAKYKPTEFKCPNCGRAQTHYAWDDKEKDMSRCEVCDTSLGKNNIILKSDKRVAPGIRTDTKNRV